MALMVFMPKPVSFFCLCIVLSQAECKAYQTDGHSESAAIPIVDPTSAKRNPDVIRVHSANVSYTDQHITASYPHHFTEVSVEDGIYNVTPKETTYEFRTERKVPKTGFVLLTFFCVFQLTQ